MAETDPETGAPDEVGARYRLNENNYKTDHVWISDDVEPHLIMIGGKAAKTRDERAVLAQRVIACLEACRDMSTEELKAMAPMQFKPNDFDFVWRLIERALWDGMQSTEAWLDVLKHAPHAPWNDPEIEWDVSHLPYAERMRKELE